MDGPAASSDKPAAALLEEMIAKLRHLQAESAAEVLAAYARGYREAREHMLALISDMPDPEVPTDRRPASRLSHADGIEALGFSVGLYNALKKEGFHAIADLFGVPDGLLLDFRLLGRVRLAELDKKLHDAGFRRGPSIDVSTLGLSRDTLAKLRSGGYKTVAELRYALRSGYLAEYSDEEIGMIKSSLQAHGVSGQ